MFESITNSLDLNRRRAELYQEKPQEEWPIINAAYSKRMKEIRSQAKSSGKVELKVIKPRISFHTHPDTQTDAIYSAEVNMLAIFKLHFDKISKVVPPRENTIVLNISPDTIQFGIKL